MKDFTLRNLHHKIRLILILINFLLISCKETKGQEKKDSADRYEWSAAVSAPKFYPAAGTVNFGYAGAGQNTPFDPGWGNQYGSFVTGERYKPIPKEVFIDYASATDSLPYKGTLKLPKEKILQIFKENERDFRAKHDSPYSAFSSYIVVGMAPGGWIRVWVRGNNDFKLKEVLKAKLPTYKDSKLNKAYGNRNDWEEKSIYWQKHGVPYEAWAENEKVYDINFDFQNENPNFTLASMEYYSLDGSVFGCSDGSYDTVFDKMKLPVEMVLAWKKNENKKWYDTHIVFPKNFQKFVENSGIDKFKLLLEIENNGEYATLYIVTNKKDKLLRFKGSLSKSEVLGDSDYSPKVEYFIK